MSYYYNVMLDGHFYIYVRHRRLIITVGYKHVKLEMPVQQRYLKVNNSDNNSLIFERFRCLYFAVMKIK